MISPRAPVWNALSDLFLDTDLIAVGEFGIGLVARALARSPYSIEALREIELWEVAPVAMPDPRDVAPPWCSLPSEFLAKHCARRAARRGWYLRQRVRFGFDRDVREFTQRYWDYLVPRIAELRAGVAP